MECIQERPKGKQRHRRAERHESDLGSCQQERNGDVEGQNQALEETLDDLKDENSCTRKGNSVSCKESDDSMRQTLNSLNASLSEQQEVFRNEEAHVESKRQAVKDRISLVFSNFRELFAKKESELIDKVDLEYTTAGNFLADFINNIEDEKQKVNDFLYENRPSVVTGEESLYEQVKTDILTNLNVRDEVLDQFQVPYFVVNEQCLDTLKGLAFGDFQTIDEDTQTNGEDSIVCCDRNPAAYENEIVSITDADSSLAETTTGTNHEHYAIGGSENTEGEQVDNQEKSHEKESEACGATGVSSEASVPSAPPISPEESPPPYWQAMGLQGPPDAALSRSEIPGYFDIPHSSSNRLPDNKVEPWHSFPVRRQYDRRGPMLVALTWNHGKICVADKTNMRVKFFFPNGQLITEMFFSGTEIHDMTFLEESQGESRYLLTSPKSKTLVIIGIDNWNTPKVIRKLAFAQQYSCVCRGPRVQTLIGAELKPGTPTVNMFTFTGQILLSISHTPTFLFLQHIRSLEVSGNNIIVLDWKLNSVSVFQDDGTPVAEYRGTSNFPLINPLDITLDNHGNIMILNGEFSNIHVVDIHCNFVEIIELPRNVPVPSSSSAKLIAFDTQTRRLAVAKSNGEVAVFTFQGGYDCLPQRNLPPNIASPHNSSSGRRAPDVLPLVEGMLPSTIEEIITRQPVRNRSRQFHL